MFDDNDTGRRQGRTEARTFRDNFFHDYLDYYELATLSPEGGEVV